LVIEKFILSRIQRFQQATHLNSLLPGQFSTRNETTMNGKTIIHTSAFAARATVRILGALFMVCCSSLGQTQELPAGCGSLRVAGRFGPYDYRADHYVPDVYRSHALLLKTVEDFHFIPEIETLQRGKTGGPPGGDLSYTLHAFPNHYRALLAMVALGEREKTDKPMGVPYPVECWFQRAIAWRPDDNIVRLLYASYLAKKNRGNDADRQLVIASNNAVDNPFTHQNIGLVYFDMGKYDLALKHAHKAIELGLNRPELKDQLAKVGKWSEPSAQKSANAVKNPP
jgi:tetratricopeptide (TPR) repeat protein